MKETRFENGAVLLQNNVVLEGDEIEIYTKLCKELDKLVKNVEGLGRKALPDGTDEAVRAKGREILKTSYNTAYERLCKDIGKLANEYIREYCFSLMFYKDAAGTMLVDPLEMIKGYITDKTPDVKKAIYEDYSMDEFTLIVNEIREKITALAIMNWKKHQDINSKR